MDSPLRSRSRKPGVLLYSLKIFWRTWVGLRVRVRVGIGVGVGVRGWG